MLTENTPESLGSFPNSLLTWDLRCFLSQFSRVICSMKQPKKFPWLLTESVCFHAQSHFLLQWCLEVLVPVWFFQRQVWSVSVPGKEIAITTWLEASEAPGVLSVCGFRGTPDSYSVLQVCSSCNQFITLRIHCFWLFPRSET